MKVKTFGQLQKMLRNSAIILGIIMGIIEVWFLLTITPALSSMAICTLLVFVVALVSFSYIAGTWATIVSMIRYKIITPNTSLPDKPIKDN